MICAECKKMVGRSMVRIAHMTSRKDLSGKKQWRTKKAKHICQKCWAKRVRPGQAQRSIMKNYSA